MPRPLRIEMENGWYHVMNRGAAHRDIFHTDRQRLIFLDLLADAVSLFGIKIHAYCLMSNHYHLLIQTPRANLAQAMRYINGVYTQRYNRLQEIDGSLFRGRYKAILVDKDNYLLEVSRYIHNNPVMAGICCYSYDYKWSSSQFYYGMTKCPNWVTLREVVSLLSERGGVLAYGKFMSEGVNENIIKFYKKDYTSVILGDKSFKDKHLNRLNDKKIMAAAADYNRTKDLPSLDDIIDICQEYYNSPGLQVTPRDYRKITMYACRQWSSDTLHNIAKRFNCKSSANVGKNVKYIKLRLIDDGNLRALLTELEKLVLSGGK